MRPSGATDHRFVHGAGSFDDDTVGRYLFARANTEFLAHLDRV
jgi:hypothetical protein